VANCKIEDPFSGCRRVLGDVDNIDTHGKDHSRHDVLDRLRRVGPDQRPWMCDGEAPRDGEAGPWTHYMSSVLQKVYQLLTKLRFLLPREETWLCDLCETPG